MDRIGKCPFRKWLSQQPLAQRAERKFFFSGCMPNFAAILNSQDIVAK